MAASRKARGLRARFADTFELPPEVVLDIPRITITGNFQLTILNHRGITEYSPERVVIGTDRGQLVICGEGLEIGYAYPEEVTVQGQVASVTFSR